MNFEHHPCFSEGAKHKYGRIHLPVAPKCNMQCNYCNRDFECVNESRPGVTRTVLTPRQAADYLDAVLAKIENIAVVGIAGPGDPFANGKETVETLRLVRKRHPEMMLCLATNGLALADYLDDLETLKISHVTVTVNAVDPEISRPIYDWARVNQKMYRGLDAARIILEKQLEGIKLLKDRGIVVKINTVIIPGINDGHVEAVARTMADLKADIMNGIPLYPVAGTPFADKKSPSVAEMAAIKEKIKRFMPLMGHCNRCRADAAGLIGHPQGKEVMELLKKAAEPKMAGGRPYAAVASREGIFVNQHLGEATELWIFGIRDAKGELLERRFTPSSGNGPERWAEMVNLLHDCNSVLVSGIGSSPQQVLEQADIRVVVMEGMAAEGVEAALLDKEIPKILLRTPGRCGIGQQCSGTGTGCG